MENITTPLYVAYTVSNDTNVLLDNKLGFNKDFDDSYHCTVLYSKKEVTVEEQLLVKREHSIPLITTTVIGYRIFESETYGRSFVLVLDSDEFVKTHNRLMDKYDASFDYSEYVPHLTILYDLPQNINPIELYKRYKGMELTFDKLVYESFDDKKYT